MQSILKLIRFKNLLIIALTQCLIRYAFLKPTHADLALTDFQFVLLVIATLCIAAAGYVINDINDVDADEINKPNKVVIGKILSEDKAYNLFLVLNVLGVGIGFYLSNTIGKSVFFTVFVLTSALLYLYSTYIKGIAFLGNITVSGIVAFSLILVGIFDLIPAISETNRDTQFSAFKVILFYALFAFLINLIREMVKDIEDTDGDYNAGYNTLPILLGRERATQITFVLSVIPLVGLVYYLVTDLYDKNIPVIYFLGLVIGPLLYTVIKLFSAEKRADYKHISLMLKVVMLTGVLSLLLYYFKLM